MPSFAPDYTECPECGEQVHESSLIAHAEAHWPELHLRQMESIGDARHYAEARARKNALLSKE